MTLAHVCVLPYTTLKGLDCLGDVTELVYQKLIELLAPLHAPSNNYLFKNIPMESLWLPTLFKNKQFVYKSPERLVRARIEGAFPFSQSGHSFHITLSQVNKYLSAY